MTSNSLCNETPADRILATLKRGGAATHAVLAAELSVSIEAVRQQMGRLEQAGLVRAHDEVRGIGRPVRVWSLTAADNQIGVLQGTIVDDINEFIGGKCDEVKSEWEGK